MTLGELPARGVAIPPFYAGQIGARAAERARRGLAVIPMHFGTFPALTGRPNQLQKLVPGVEVLEMKPGQTIGG